MVRSTPRCAANGSSNIRSMIGNDSTVAVCSYADMPIDEAERNLRLFSDKVKPRLQATS